MSIEHLPSSMIQVIRYLEDQFVSLQLGKANPKFIESVSVFIPSYGMTQKIHEVASVTTMDSQTLKIEPRDKAVLSAIDKWITDANLGLTPSNQWSYLMIKFPALTTERRIEIGKIVKKYGEEGKIGIRNIRHDATKYLKTQEENKEIGESDRDVCMKKIDEITKEMNEKIDELVKQKSEEVMKV